MKEHWAECGLGSTRVNYLASGKLIDDNSTVISAGTCDIDIRPEEGILSLTHSFQPFLYAISPLEKGPVLVVALRALQNAANHGTVQLLKTLNSIFPLLESALGTSCVVGIFPSSFCTKTSNTVKKIQRPRRRKSFSLREKKVVVDCSILLLLCLYGTVEYECC